MTGECEYLIHGNLCQKSGACDNKDSFARYVKLKDEVIVYGVCEVASVF